MSVPGIMCVCVCVCVYVSSELCWLPEGCGGRAHSEEEIVLIGLRRR